jgi:hypothetical protein
VDIKLIKTCSVCPEQYEAYLGDRQVGYLRLRGGSFTVNYPDVGGLEIYHGYPEGQDEFRDHERFHFTYLATAAIRKQLKAERVAKTSWFTGLCGNCNYNIVVTQPDHLNFPTDDYWWYCSNKKCKHHEVGEHTGDQDYPEWANVW